MAEKDNSKETDLFRLYSSQFKDAILNPSVLASELYSSSFIDEYTRDSVCSHRAHASANILVNAVETYVKKQKKAKQLVKDFEKILDIFRKHTPLNSVVELLEIDYYGQNQESKEMNLVLEETGSEEEAVASRQKKSRKRKKKKKSTAKDHSIITSPLMEESQSYELPVETPSLEDKTENYHDKVSQQAMEQEIANSVPESTKSEGMLLQASPRESESPFSVLQMDNNQQCDVSQYSDDTEQESSRFNDLVIAFRVYSSDLSISGVDIQAILNLFKAHIENHIKKELEDGLLKDALKKQLNELTINALIPMDINDWCYIKLEELCKEYDDKPEIKDTSNDKVDDPTDEPPPLFTNDVVYHSSLCNLFLSLVDCSGKKKLSNFLAEYGHSFDAISISQSGKMKMLIAQQGDIVYVTFDYDQEDAYSLSLDNSIEKKELPLRYFCELLHQNKRLVLTGSSFGSLSALSILSQLWHRPYFSADKLRQNLVCIIFGLLPPLPINMFIFNQEKSIRSLCNFFTLEGHAHKFFTMSAPLWGSFKKAMNFYTEYCQNLLYLIYQTPDGLNWTKQVKQHYFKEDDMATEYSMTVYHRRVIRGYLDKEGYKIPPRNKLSIGPVQSLLPSISEIEIYQHKHPDGSELVVVIKGDNLWFCNSIEVELDCPETPIKIITFAETVTQKQISYNQLFDHTVKMTEGQTNDYCSVKVYSKFASANPLIISDVPMIYNEPDNISFRQSQLAKQTPSQIISLSFLSALLEQSSSLHSGRPTKRTRQIIKFLQEASSIVPMESALFAVAFSDNEKSAVKIAQATVNSAQKSSIPVSEMMAFGCDAAMRRLNANYSTPDLFKTCDYYANHPHKVLKSDSQVHDNAGHYSSKSKKKHKRKSANAVHRQSSVSLIHRDLQLFSSMERFLVMCKKVEIAAFITRSPQQLICGRNIGEMYPISKAVSSPSDSDPLTPLPQILQNARKRLTALSIEHKETNCTELNRLMLAEVNKIVEDDLEPCVTMLGGFMEQQIRVPLVNNPLDTAKALREAQNCGAAVGVWALFALSHKDIESILKLRENKTLLIQIEKFIKGSLSDDVAKNIDDAESTTSYNAKLQFLLQGFNKTVTCSSNYISYSLERELVGICKERDISTSVSITSVVRNWDERFQDTALVLVPNTYRPLLARWLIWSLNIHQLREGLASYTTIGIIGLVNSGKSTLVDKVFKVKTVQGTTQSARTTVPFIYNFDSSVEGLSVIDFPGVDDKDESIGGLAKLLVGLAQIVIFVCGYERFHTSSAEEWMEIFKNDFAATPILVCLTYADRLYEEKCDTDMLPECPEDKIGLIKSHFEYELEKIIGSTQKAKNCIIKFCSLTQSRHSVLNNDKGRQSMRKVGIFSPEDIGEWIKHALTQVIQQQDLADKFQSFLIKNSS